MSEAAAACYNTAPVYATPTIVQSAGNGTGSGFALANSLIGDHIFLWMSADTATVPNTPSLYTSAGSGLDSVESGGSSAVRLAIKKVTANAEGAPSNSGSSRTCAVVVRDLDPNYITNLLSSHYAYNDNPGVGNLIVPGLTLPRTAPVLCFSKRAGISATPMTGLTELIAVNPANGEVRAAWTNGNVASFSGYSYSISLSTSKIAASILLLGRQTS